MLIVFRAAPIAAPRKTMFDEKSVAEVALFELIRVFVLPVRIFLSGLWLYPCAPVLARLHAGILQGIDIDSQPLCMRRQMFAACDDAVTET